MDFRKLRYFVEVVDAGSLTGAASQLHVAQPALSKSIHALESELGTALLQRSGHGVSATEAGMRLYQHCQIILRDVDRARLEVRKAGEAPHTRVSIGMPLSIAAVLGVPLLREVSGQFPELNIELMQAHSHQIGTELRSGRLDLAVMARPRMQSGLCLQAAVVEELYFVGKREAGRSGHPHQISFAEAAAQSYILPSIGNGLRTAAESYFRARSLELNVTHEIDAVGILPRCVDAGLGASLLPGGFIQRDPVFEQLDVRAFEGGCSRLLAICYPERGISAAAQAVMSMIERIISDLVMAGEWLGSRNA